MVKFNGIEFEEQDVGKLRADKIVGLPRNKLLIGPEKPVNPVEEAMWSDLTNRVAQQLMSKGKKPR